MPALTEEYKSQVVKATIARLGAPPGTITVLGRVTEMTCRCGGKLQESRVVVNVSLPKPTHRKKRILKKLLKKWEKDSKLTRLMSSFVGLMRKPTYKCTVCDKHEGFYSAMGRNLFPVQSMDSPKSLLDYSDSTPNP